MISKAKSTDQVAAMVEKQTGSFDGAMGGGTFYVTCYDQDGNLKWEAKAKNLVTKAGLQNMNDRYFLGSSYTAAWYIGLVDNAGFTAYSSDDTMASHAGWNENTSYTGLNRGTASFGSPTLADPSVISNSSSQASFSVNGTATIRGAFLTTTQDNGTNTGILFSAADFEAPGSRSVVSGDTLNVRYDFSLADA
jgi:hypothetical protein